MKDKVLRLKNGLQYYVVDEITEGKKTYIFAMQVDNDIESTTNNYIVCYYNNVLNKEDMALNDIYDKMLYQRILNEFLKRLINK